MLLPTSPDITCMLLVWPYLFFSLSFFSCFFPPFLFCSTGNLIRILYVLGKCSTLNFIPSPIFIFIWGQGLTKLSGLALNLLRCLNRSWTFGSQHFSLPCTWDYQPVTPNSSLPYLIIPCMWASFDCFKYHIYTSFWYMPGCLLVKALIRSVILQTFINHLIIFLPVLLHYKLHFGKERLCFSSAMYPGNQDQEFL